MAKAKILTIDDNQVICELIQSRLEANGYEVIYALFAQEGLQKAHDQQLDLILLDISMSTMDGLEVGRRLKEDERTKHIPIIMVTAKGDQASIVKATKDAGALDYVAKPFRPEKLLQAVERVLNSSGLCPQKQRIDSRWLHSLEAFLGPFSLIRELFLHNELHTVAHSAYENVSGRDY